MAKPKLDITKKLALSRLMKTCSGKEICFQDARKKLVLWSIDPAEQEEILAQLKKDNFINEDRYALAFTRDKLQFNRWGRTKISYQLRMKGVPQSSIDKAFLNLEDFDMESMIRSSLENKLRNTKANSNYELKGKLYRFAVSRGYDNEIVFRILDDIIRED